MPAEAGATPAPETTVQPTAPVQLETPNPKPQTPPAPTRRRPSLGQRPDGVPDVLDAIADLGGIRAPGAQKGTAEYDGYAAAFNEGGPSAVLRGGSQRPDLLLRGLQEHGFRFETIDEMYDAVSRANAARDALTQQIKQQRTVRPEMVDRVRKLYDAAVAGQPVTQTELGELDSRLTERERKMLAQPLKELGTMADVAPAAAQPDALEQVLDSLKADFKPSQLHAFGLLPATWNQLIEVVRLAYRGGKTAAQAIRAGMAWLQAQGLKDYDHPAVHERLIDEAIVGFQRARTSVAEQIRQPMAGRPVNLAFDPDMGGGGWNRREGMSNRAAEALSAGRMTEPQFKQWLADELGIPLKAITSSVLNSANARAQNIFREYHHVGQGGQVTEFYDPAAVERQPKFWLGLAEMLRTKSHKVAAKSAALEAWQRVREELTTAGELGTWSSDEPASNTGGQVSKLFNPAVARLRLKNGISFPEVVRQDRADKIAQLRSRVDHLKRHRQTGRNLREAEEELAKVENANAPIAGGVAGIKTSSETQPQRPEGQADKGSVSALRTEGASALTSLKTTQPSADVKLSPIEAAKADVRQAWGDLQTLGIVQDPKRDAEKAFALYKALFKLATAYAKKGMKTAAEFAAKTGLKLDAIVQAAWEDAVAGKAKPNALELDVAAVTDLTDNLRQHKFSQRIAPDLAPQLAAASAGNVHAVKPMALTAAEAYAHVTERGLVQAAQDVKDEGNELTLDQRVAIAQAVITQSNHAFAQTGDQASFDAALDMILFTDERLGLETGRGLNAFKLWNRMSPDGYVREYVRTVNKSARRLGIPANIDKDLAKRIRAAAQAALAKPAGFQQDEALIDVMAMIARAKGIPKMDVATALWYANILSGYPSWLRNAAGNVGFLFAEATTHAATRPQHIPAVLAGLYNGFLEGVPQAVNVLRTGKQTGPRVGKVVEAPRVLELVKFKGLAYPLNAWKYVFRIMAATDMVAFSSAQEMHARFLARELVRTGQADGQTYSQLLATAAVQRAAARQQAEAEGLSGINYRRRIAEILQQQRPESVTAPSAAAALYATFNQPPRGVLGAVANHISQLSQQFAPLRTVTPFTQIVANVFNNTLDYTPWGYRRLFPSVFLKDRAGRKDNWLPGYDNAPLDYQLQAARATLGTVGLAALWALSQSFGDEDDHWFDVSGNGPSNLVEREGLKETGWRPYSVKLGGRWTSYQQAPIATGLAWLGFLRDIQRTKTWLNMDDWSRFAYAGTSIGTALLSQSFVSGLSDFLRDLANDSADPNGPKFRWATRTAGTVIPAAIKSVDKLADPTIYDSGRFPQALLRDIPYARSQLLKPALNALGEPIRPPGTFSSLANPDPLWALLAEKQSLPGKPSTSTMVGDRPITPEEYYELIRVRGQWLGQQLRRPEMMAIMERLPAERVQQYVERYSDAATKVARAKLKLRPATPAR